METPGQTALEALLAATQTWHAALPETTAFTPWPDDLRYEPRAPLALPHIATMQANPGAATALSQPLQDALLAAAPHVEWRHTYTEAEVGAEFLQTYGWFELAGPEGHFVTDQARITVGYWGPGLHYGRHQHGPEELYTIVSGSAVFHADDEADTVISAEGTRYHRAHQPHAMTTLDHPILALVLWRGEGLDDIPRMTA